VPKKEQGLPIYFCCPAFLISWNRAFSADLINDIFPFFTSQTPFAVDTYTGYP
jgi:hypothetical protein